MPPVRPFRRSRRLGRGARHTTALVAMALIVFASVGASASANFLDYCTGCFVGAHNNIYGADHTLSASQAYDDGGQRYICAAAHYNGALFASYACSNGVAVHCYSQTHVLKPLAHNIQDFAIHMHGRELWAEQCP